MIFGTEVPFHLKRLPHRGMRQVDAEVVHHYPHYEHPMKASTRRGDFMCEEHRLHPTLTVNDELYHERAIAKQQQEKYQAFHRKKYKEREEALEQRRNEEFARGIEYNERIAGTNIKNRGSENRNVITHQCHTQEGKDYVEYKEALGRYGYFNRQKSLDSKNCPTGLNTITWEPRRTIEVPPVPKRPACLLDRESAAAAGLNFLPPCP